MYVCMWKRPIYLKMTLVLSYDRKIPSEKGKSILNRSFGSSYPPSCQHLGNGATHTLKYTQYVVFMHSQILGVDPHGYHIVYIWGIYQWNIRIQIRNGSRKFERGDLGKFWQVTTYRISQIYTHFEEILPKFLKVSRSWPLETTLQIKPKVFLVTFCIILHNIWAVLRLRPHIK